MSDTSKKITREFDRLCRTNAKFKEFVKLFPDASMDELLMGWGWVQDLTAQVIQRTVRDLTGSLPHATLCRKKER